MSKIGIDRNNSHKIVGPAWKMLFGAITQKYIGAKTIHSFTHIRDSGNRQAMWSTTLHGI